MSRIADRVTIPTSRLSVLYLWVTYSSSGRWQAELSIDPFGEHVVWSVPGFETKDQGGDHARAWCKKYGIEVR